MKEVSQLSDYLVEVLPVKTGRSVTHVELPWWRKDGAGRHAAERELQFSKVGRKARSAGQTETVTPETAPGEGKPRPAWLDRHGPSLEQATYSTARLRHPGFDVYAIEAEWRSWARGKAAANDPDRAFLAFMRKFTEANPL